MKKHLKSLLKILLPLALGGGILWWTYRDFDFAVLNESLFAQMSIGWLLFSLVFEVLSHVFRGLRWKLTLDPLGEHPRASTCINAIFLSYAVSLLIPRSGEVARCGVLKRYDGVSFTKSLGTVVTERVVDLMFVASIALMVVALQFEVFQTFFMEKVQPVDESASVTGSTNLLPWAIAGIAVCVAGYFLTRHMKFTEKVKGVLGNLWEGVCSIRRVKNIPLFLFYSLAIWGCYIMQFYLTFFAFPFTEDLGFKAGLAVFMTTSFAVLVPTPNGAGPWHYVVISTLTLIYGVSEPDAGIFALIVHGMQTLALILLGVWSMVALGRTKKNDPHPCLPQGE